MEDFVRCAVRFPNCALELLTFGPFSMVDFSEFLESIYTTQMIQYYQGILDLVKLFDGQTFAIWCLHC